MWGPMSPEPDDRSFLTRFAWLSIAAALATMGLKAAAYLLTGSVGLLSDALESLVNLIGALLALAMLSLAARPPDESHSYGHSKAEYFSSGVEGGLILIAAASIAVAAVRRLIAPRPIENVGVAMNATHKMMTGLFGSTVTLSDHAAFDFEPLPTSTCNGSGALATGGHS